MTQCREGTVKLMLLCSSRKNNGETNLIIVNGPVSMPRGPGAGPALADMTAPSRAASAGPAVEWKMVQLWPTVDGPLLASLHVAIIF